MSRRSFFIGRWQPLHAGHVAIIRKVLDEGHPVLIGIMETPSGGRNPLSVEERRQLFWQEFMPEMLIGKLALVVLPWIAEVCHGRDTGWDVRRIDSTPELEAISGTALRAAGAL